MRDQAVVVDKVTIAIDAARMATFCAAVLGMGFQEVDIGGPKLQVGRIGNVELLICPREVAGIDAVGNTIQLRLRVADVDGAVRAAQASGGSVINDPVAHGTARFAAVRDPEGNSLELLPGDRPAVEWSRSGDGPQCSRRLGSPRSPPRP